MSSKLTHTNLLAWSIQNKSEEEKPAKVLEKIDTKWLDIIMGKPEAVRMKEIIEEIDALISRLLVIQPEDPKLLCLLGDVRGDKRFYENAWKLSGNRFSRAMRSLGSYYFSAEDWSLSIECYDKALAINPMFENSWFIMGCSALRIDDFTTASRAFNRVVQIDPDVIFN